MVYRRRWIVRTAAVCGVGPVGSSAMRTHGWGGNPPRDDDEAVARILAATRESIDVRGSSTGLADVARALGVTRQTIYRYFSGTEELLLATALGAVGELLDRMTARLEGIDEPDRAVVEGIVAVCGDLAQDDYVGLVLRGDHLSLGVIGGFTSDVGRQFARSMTERFTFDWAELGYDDDDLDDVSEIILRTLQTLVLDDPAGSTRSEDELRRFLDRWVGAAVREIPARRRE